MAIPFFLFVALPVLGVVVLLWCYMCFKIGAWIIHALFPPRRVRPVYADVPLRAAYQPPPPMPQRPVRPIRRRGSGGAFMMLLVVVAVVLGFRSFAHQRQVSRERREVARWQTQARAEAKRARKAKAPVPPVVAAAEPKEMVVLVDAPEEVIPATQLPTDEQKSGWVLGYGRSREDANQAAQDKAYEKAVAYLHETLPGLQWTPTRDYVQKHLVKECQVLSPEEKEILPGRPENVERVKLHVEVSSADMQDIVKQDRTERGEQRMALLAKVLGIAVLLFSAVAAYVRIDEFSKGYLTGWLRLAGIVTVAAAGLFLFMR